MNAVRLALAHGIAGDDAAAAVAIRIVEAAGGHADHAAAVGHDIAKRLSVVTDASGGFTAELRGVFADGKNAEITGSGDTDKQQLVRRVDRKHLFALLGIDARTAVV